MFKYENDLKNAVRSFWTVRNSQQFKQKARNRSDQGNRGVVTGGKQMDAFVELLTKITLKSGVPKKCIYTNQNELPGFFRPTKKWISS